MVRDPAHMSIEELEEIVAKRRKLKASASLTDEEKDARFKEGLEKHGI